MTAGAALLAPAVLFIGFALGSQTLDVGAPLLISVMLLAAAVAGPQARAKGHDWNAIQRSCGQRLADVLPAVLILLAIGMLIGSWVMAGTIPWMVTYGLRLISPEHIVPTAFLATASMSLVTGTSWGSAGTLGVALMGMAGALGAPLGATAGAVVSGAYFGDKMSPLSDSTNIAAISADAPLYAHIRHMTTTAVPSFVIALGAYLVLPSATGPTNELPSAAQRLTEEIELAFSPGLWIWLPPLIIGLGILLRLPAAPTIALSSVVALAVGIGHQGFGLGAALITVVDGFEASMLGELGLDPDSFGPELLGLLNRGGLTSMSGTLLMIIAAFLLASGMELSGAFDTLLQTLLRGVRGAFGLIAATMIAGAVMISITSHGGVTSLIVGGLFQKAYRLRGLAAVNLSRSLEDSVTLVEPLMPWTVSALFMAGTLGVPTVTYGPWAVFCYCGPIFSLLWAAVYRFTGSGLKPLTASPDLEETSS